MNMDWTSLMYGAYLIISVAITIWVAHTLKKNGQIFLNRAFDGDIELATSINQLLVVGFYLINIGWIVFSVKYGPKVENMATLIEGLTWRIGIVLLILGVMHFLNLRGFNNLRKKAELRNAAPPVAPDYLLEPEGA